MFLRWNGSHRLELEQCVSVRLVTSRRLYPVAVELVRLSLKSLCCEIHWPFLISVFMSPETAVDQSFL